MKRILRESACIILLLFFVTSGGKLFSQTSGTCSFSVTTISNGGFSPSHLSAIWIETNSTAFVKTKIKYSSDGNLVHLATWDAKSGRNTVDAVTGPTLTSHGTITFLWNGTNVVFVYYQTVNV